jgi:uncharacterized Zn finger protein
MPSRARNLKSIADTPALRSTHVLRCIVCDRRIETKATRRTKELMVRCRHCGTLQHRRIDSSSKKRSRRK